MLFKSEASFLQRTITLKENLKGFEYRARFTSSPFGLQEVLTAETSLGLEFAAGWGKKKEKCFKAKSNLEPLKQKV